MWLKIIYYPTIIINRWSSGTFRSSQHLWTDSNRRSCACGISTIVPTCSPIFHWFDDALDFFLNDLFKIFLSILDCISFPTFWQIHGHQLFLPIQQSEAAITNFVVKAFHNKKMNKQIFFTFVVFACILKNDNEIHI